MVHNFHSFQNFTCKDCFNRHNAYNADIWRITTLQPRPPPNTDEAEREQRIMEDEKWGRGKTYQDHDGRKRKKEKKK